MKKIGLYFGTFNPIHNGHLILANHFAEFTDLEEVWFVITPKSPFKQKQSLLANHHRYQMVQEAIKTYPKLKASTIEFALPQPNYTINTLVHLTEKYGKAYAFTLLMGEDNLKSFHKWKNYQAILQHYAVYAYPRISAGETVAPIKDHPKVSMVHAPVVEISSTFIRQAHTQGKNIRPLVPPEVWQYLDEMNFYR